MHVKITIKGHRELQKQLLKLPDKMAKKVARGAIRAGGRIVVKAARAHVPVRSGTLKASLGTRSRSYRGGAISAVVIGPRSGRKRQIGVVQRGRKAGDSIYADPSKYAAFVEFGANAQPFLGPALLDNTSKVIAKVHEVVAKGVVREALKLRGKR